MPKSLRTFLSALKEQAPEELQVIRKPVDPAHWEATAIAEQLHRRGQHPALLFERPLNVYGKPSDVPLALYVFGSRQRCAVAMDLPTSRWREVGQAYARRSKDPAPGSGTPVVVSPAEAPVKEVVRRGEEADLYELPLARSYSLDASPYINMTLVVKDPDEGFYDLAFIRAQCKGPRHIATYMSVTRHPWMIFQKYEERGLPCPVAYIIGHHPAFYLGGLTIQPFGVDEYGVIGNILNEPLRLVPSETWGEDFLVPADAEEIVEGVFVPGARELEGPFAEWCGYAGVQQYSNAPVIEVQAITRRHDAIHQHVFPGARPDVLLLGVVAKEGDVYNEVRGRVPGVTGVAFLPSGLNRLFCAISLKKRAEGEQQHAAIAALAACEYIKWCILVDDDIDVYDEQQVWWAVATRCQPHDDFLIIPKMKHEQIDPSLHEYFYAGSKVIIDATRELDRDWPPVNEVPKQVMDRIKLEDYC